MHVEFLIIPLIIVAVYWKLLCVYEHTLYVHEYTMCVHEHTTLQMHCNDYYILVLN